MKTTPRQHVLITGTGRAGTTFLVQLLTHLGLETGFTPETMILHEVARAGLEHNLLSENAPYITKMPWFCHFAEKILRRRDILIQHVFIPMRDLHAAAESRRYVNEQTVSKMPFLQRLRSRVGPPAVPGGLWLTKRKRHQEAVLLNELYNLILALSNTQIPITLLRYPRLVQNSAYLFEKLRPILGDIDYTEFCEAFEKTARPELVHRFNRNDC